MASLCAIAVVLVIFDAPGWTFAVLPLLVFALTAKGAIKWFTTLHVITNERVIYRAGFIATRGKEIPLTSSTTLPLIRPSLRRCLEPAIS